MKFEDRNDIWKTLALCLGAFIITVLLTGCGSTPTEYSRIDRSNQCFDLARQYPRYTISDTGYTIFARGVTKRCPELLDRRKRRAAGLS